MTKTRGITLIERTPEEKISYLTNLAIEAIIFKQQVKKTIKNHCTLVVKKCLYEELRL